ncbi:putative beta-calactosidase [Diaporthe sp. PMI_573]|nr:putative beta-calactosidase [Diaporthaceae sp. PMI_573]
MKLEFLTTSALVALFQQARASTPPRLPTAAGSFTYNNKSFFLHGEPFTIIGGQMDPQRIPPEYWRDRLAKANAMGLNTIFSYVYWNLLEPEPGEWRSNEPSNDIARYFEIAQEEGLSVVLRPGPYICGERDWGGFPSWLSTIPGLTVRTYNEPYLNYSTRYLERLAADLQHLQVTKGGPLLMVQVENEYGSYGSNHEYTEALRDVLLKNYDVPLYTNDGGVEFTLVGGSVPGVLAAIDGDPSSGFAARDKYITDPSKLGPLLDGEYYTLAPDIWGSENPHNVAKDDDITRFAKDLDWVLGANNSISLYMFHGGTNFALGSGSIWRNKTSAFTTSYDYGSPLDESGRTTDYYFTLRDTIKKYSNRSLSEVPANVPVLSIPEIQLAPRMQLLDTTGASTSSDLPTTMEELGQDYGFVLYEHKVTQAMSGLLQPGDRPRDRVIVYVNEARIGVIDSIYQFPMNITLDVNPGDTVSLLVENLGRVDYWSLEAYTFDGLTDPYKGIVGNVTIGNVTLRGWTMKSFPLGDVPPLALNTNNSGLAASPIFYSGVFKVQNYSNPAELDTFIAIPNGTKGMVWVNGFNLGRYWIIGPQQSLYLPGTVLKAGQNNDIVVLELEPDLDRPMFAKGEAARTWGNNPDPDYI